MRIGFLTNIFGDLSLDKIANWAAENGFEFLEVGPHIPLEKEIFKRIIDDYGVDVIGLIFCRNFQDQNEIVRRKLREDLQKRIDLACEMGFKFITISTGVNKKKSFEENLLLFKEFITPILEKCESYGVRVALENCPMTGNIATSPHRWKEIFKVINSRNLGLCYDPSHLIRLFIDPYKPILNFADKIFYVHAKDTQLDEEKLSSMGIEESRGWWEYRLPGFGIIDWNRFTATLRRAEFDGEISIEHEDAVWLGSEEKIKNGLLLAKNYIQNCPFYKLST